MAIKKGQKLHFPNFSRLGVSTNFLPSCAYVLQASGHRVPDQCCSSLLVQRS